MRFNLVFNSLGYILKRVGIIVLLPVVFALITGEKSEILPFLICSLTSIFTGFFLEAYSGGNVRSDELKKGEALCVACFTWILFGLICSIPYFFYHFTTLDAIFEAYSGITTTGLSLISDYSLYPKTFFFFRSMTQWIGGMGIIVLFIAVLPKFAVAGRQMFSMELPGPVEDKFTPRIHQTALWLWSMYIGLTVIQIFCLKLFGGMDFYDAICVSFSTISSGGFSQYPDSIAHYGSDIVNWIVIIFMFLAGCNFVLQYKVIIQRKFSLLFRNTEFWVYLGIVLLSAIGIFAILFSINHIEVHKAITNSIFMSISTITTTGFNVSDFEFWNFDARAILFLLMFFGACASSTSGGIKITRWVFLAKYLKNELSKIIHPQAIYPIKIDNKTVSQDVRRQLLAFVFFYIAIFAITAFIIGLIEESVSTAISGSITTLGNCGVAFGDIIGPNGDVHSLHSFTKIIFIFNMVIGRLELIPVLALFQPELWRKIN